MRPPHLCSLYSIFIETYSINKINGTQIPLSTATACLYQHNDEVFLITNWHVLSGKNAVDLKNLDSNARLPEFLRAHFPKDGQIEECKIEEYALYNGEEPTWLEHPLQNKVDVAALKITAPSGIANYHVSDALQAPSFTTREDFFFVTQDVWVIGYPRSIRVGNMPIWKRATIATEPRFSSTNDRHKILLDTATREGMSGSPVLYVSKNLSPITFDNKTQEVDFPSVKYLLGIYSGRIAGEDELAAQLGIVWAAESILEILSNGKKYAPQSFS